MESLTATIDKGHTPNIESALGSLNDWLDSAEDIIATQDLDTIDHLDVTQTKIERLKVNLERYFSFEFLWKFF